MVKKVTTLMIVLLILTSALIVFNQSVYSASIPPSNLNIYVGPTTLLADNKTYTCVFLQLQDSSGLPARALQNTTISLSSSVTAIGTVNSSIMIPKGATYAPANLQTTFNPGTTTISASATGYPTVQSSITTVAPTPGTTPSKLAVYCVPSVLPSDRNTYQTIEVQLQDSQGQPAKDPAGDLSVYISSSHPTIGIVSPTLTIPFGETQATATINVTNVPGSTTITAQASNYTMSQEQIATYQIDYPQLQIVLAANPQNVYSGNKTNLIAYITADGTPTAGATLTFTSNDGGSFATTLDQGNGYYNTTFTAPLLSIAANCTLTASVSKTGYLASQNITQLTVSPPPPPSQTPSPTQIPTASNKTGTITLCILDNSGNPLNDTLVSSITQPSGIGTLLAFTNSTGYVTFENASTGSYTFKLVKDGFKTTNATINYNGQQFAMNIDLIKGDNSTTGNTPAVLIITMAGIAGAIVAASIVLMMKKGNQKRARKLRELQKQLNGK